ncbi:polysaccharide deacetylase family protein [Variovorax sp. YR752]|uniref:polysaccharide deacetylase family protein n=1 Tax=Variovorax sp. YR752 TaxID=1884383 RepID=UPI003137F008
MPAPARRFGPLRGHGRFDYSAIGERLRFTWPGGAKLAFYIGFNIEHFAFGEGLGATLAPSAPLDVLNYTWREYGNRVGVWRCLDLFDDLSLPVGALVNTALYDHCPQVVQAFAERGDELIGHGHSNAERQGGWPEADERALLLHCRERMREAQGRAPQGWLSPWISESPLTPDLLQETGYRYTLNWCHDDQPVPMRTRSGGTLWSVPYPQELNDIPMIVARQMDGKDFAQMIVDQFDEMLEQTQRGDDAPALVMGLALHPYLVGQPYRLRHLRRALKHIVGRPDSEVWVTTPGAIVDAVAGPAA